MLDKLKECPECGGQGGGYIWTGPDDNYDSYRCEDCQDTGLRRTDKLKVDLYLGSIGILGIISIILIFLKRFGAF